MAAVPKTGVFRTILLLAVYVGLDLSVSANDDSDYARLVSKGLAVPVYCDDGANYYQATPKGRALVAAWQSVELVESWSPRLSA